MTRESPDVKAARLLAEGRLTVVSVEPWHALATAKGDSGHSYDLGYTRAGWWCDCEARGRCGHMAALQRVVSPRRDPTPPSHAPRAVTR